MFFSAEKDQFKKFSRRTLILFSLKALLLSAVGLKLFNIQVQQSQKYETLSKNNRIKLKILFPTRGQIIDRNNNIIATNFKSYELYLIPEEIEDIGKVLKNLSKVISIPFKKRKKVVNLSNKVKKFEMIKLIDNLSWSQLEKIEANIINFPGVHLFSINKRYYPYENFFSHIVGYTSKPSKEDLSLPYISSMPSLEIGKAGIEKQFNETLIGAPGSRQVEINAVGREIREISKSPSTEGQKINLSVNSTMQKTIYEELIKYKTGSVVVMDVNSGEILSMLSVPDFNPNKLINKPNAKYWEEILNNSLSPLTNRVTQGLYAPGSTFKMIVALAALEKGIIDLNYNIFCEGKIEFGDRFFHCWKTKGHGKVNLIKGIEESCDCFFYDLSQKVGINDIAKMAERFGLGSITNLELPAEKKGVVPSTKWKRQTLKENWYKGETLIAGIGQGYVLSTPLQLVQMTSIIANGGYKIQPTLLKKNNKKEFDIIRINTDNLKIIREAMIKVVNEPTGTAYRSRSDPSKFTFAGKTGTSQVKKITLEEREQEDFRKKEIDWKDKDHALFVGYMPVKEPKYAICVVIEHGGSGSAAAAPIANKIFNKLHELRV